jgi:hypothetical protein
MEIISPDDEWLTYLYFMFPAGITPNPVQTSIEGNYYNLQFNSADDNSITWGAGSGDTSLGFLPTSGNPYIFEIHIEIGEGFTEPITVNYEGAGDNWGSPPHQFEGSFVIDPTLDNDLLALNVSGNTTPTEETESIYDIYLKNQGNLNQSGVDYTVELYDADDDLIGSTEGIDLDAGEDGSVQIPWTPDLTGATYIYGYINFEADENQTNNTTEYFDVNVQSLGTTLISIGTGTELSYQIPANFFYRSSLTECWYYPEEINYGGLLTQLVYHTNWVTNLDDMPLRIWMGETTQPQGVIGWIPADQLQLVFDGNIDLPPGENDIFFPLDNFFPYSGADNLVVMMERPMDNQYYSSSDRWYISNDVYHPGRTIYYYSDYEAPDPYNPPVANVLNALPNIGLFFDGTPTGSLNGYVYSNDREPLVNSLVEIEGTTFSTYTNQTGYYDFPYVFIDTYDVTASIFGYYNGTETVTIIENEITSQDIYLDHLPTVSVSGHVITSDTGADVIGANITLEGYDNYSGISTDDNGIFTIPGVYASHTYSLTIDYTGYDTYVNNNIVVGDSDLDLGDIIVNEIAIPAYDVIAEEDHDGNALIVWQSPARSRDGSLTAASRDRLLESFSIYRLLDGQQGDQDSWLVIATGVTETFYVDTTWPDVEPGVYVYAVTAIYTNGVESIPAFSQTISFEAYLAVTISISSDSGDDPAGAVAELINHDGDPSHTYSQTATQGGVIFFPEVFYGVYDLNVYLDDHSDFNQTDINIMDNTTIPVLLNELILPPENLTLQDIEEGVLLSWSAPGSVNRQKPVRNKRHLVHYNIYLNDDLIGTTTELEYLIYGYPAGLYEFGVSAYYSSGNESEIVTLEANVEADESFILNETRLIGNYPNPFNPSTEISYQLSGISGQEDVELTIYNTKGQKIKDLTSSLIPSPTNYCSVIWNGTDESGLPVPSGIYLYKMKAGKYISTKKMILMK